VSAVPAIWLASASPRRKLLLAQAGIACEVVPPAVDDATVALGPMTPPQMVTALAHLKARSAAIELTARNPIAGGLVLGADTVCLHRGTIMGQPRDADDARRMLNALQGDSHQVLTGVCLFHLPSGPRWISMDTAIVTLGNLADMQIDTYVASNAWRGKAGAYNYDEQVKAGWPLACEGDPATVMGLPIQRLPSWIERFEQMIHHTAGGSAT